ncbi:chemotaxis protein CheA [Sphingorhabdus pulchriflava]|uniref:Chemotaxis protein CheA n=1 Tax=Sphingorhabdus pulchriflava TaxID=2292257 RepID=A0A371BGJ7_9SPHN|nr:ATP-binding protein [Sphingorhabdus pulchriflava]RDV06725.1 chemotaxis protein CheA [Sphingorhabdus pulchriflava]
MDDLREEFIAETRETLEVLAGQLVQWEKNPADLGLIDSAFRFVHTVKGSCGFLDLPRLLRLSHAAEELLSYARDSRIEVCEQLVSAVLAVIDRISALTDALESGEAVRDNDSELIDAMLAFLPAERDEFDENPSNDQPWTADLVETVEELQSHPRNRTVRVSLTLLDKLMNGISDLVLARNEVSRQLRKIGASADIEHAFGRLSSTVADMRDAIGMMRMQHIDRLFASLPRALRDISVELGKQIDLTVEGSEVEVDREMVEALRDPLTHILRNAADHGIESADERRALGKDPVGRIQVQARQSGNQILVEVKDDGRGIDVERLGQKAIARKLFTHSQWQKLSDRAKLDTIFAPGLSTAESVTSISGRGVGMDVVRTNMHAIGGSIDLENEEGQGLRITLRLPLTLSIIAGLSLRAGGQTFGISRSSIVEIISVANKNVELENLGGMTIAKVRGARLAYAKLESILGIEESVESADMGRTLIIVRPAVGAVFALDVEAVIDNEELVVKPGAPLVMATGLYAGTSLPDNGRPMLLLDASGLCAAIGFDQDLFEIESVREGAVVQTETQKTESGLLFTAMDGATRAIRLSAVDRMEDLEVSSIHELGGRLCASLDGNLYDIHGLVDLPECAQIKVLRISDGSNTILLAVDDVVDIFAIEGGIAPSLHPDRYEGIVHFDSKPVELINAFHFFEGTELRAVGQSDRPLCYVECSDDDGWERRILAPLLSASGYAISFEPKDKARAQVVLSRGEQDGEPANDGRLLKLRDSVHGQADDTGSIYRYDRVALIAAIDAKIAGVR